MTQEYEVVNEHFESFPESRVQQAEAAAQARKREVYNPHTQKQGRQIATDIQMVAPGTPAPTPTHRIPPGGMRQAEAPRMPQPMAAPVQVPNPGHKVEIQVQPNSEEEAVSFALPSNFLFDDFKDLYIKPFKGRHFSKLNRAREESSMLHTLEVTSSVLWTSKIPMGLAFELTVPDFYACMYWLRMNSFMKHGFTHQTLCRNKEHHDWVAKGYRIVQDPDTGEDVQQPILPETLKYAHIISKATIKTKELKALPDLSNFQLDDPNIHLVPMRMKDVLAITMNENIDRYDARTAASFQFNDRVADLEERMAYVDNLSADDIATIARWEQVSSDYGVVESVNWQCKTCGAHHKDELNVDAHSFFPSAA